LKVLLIVYDNGSYVSEFPVGLGYLAASLREAGNDVSIYNKDIYHYPEKHLTEHLNKNSFDLVGISVVGGYWQYSELLKISKAVNDSVNRKNFIYVMGGHGPAPEPEFFLEKTNADIIVVGEGERTGIEICEGKDLSEIHGIVYIKDGRIVKNKERELIEDLDLIPFPAWDLFPMNHYVLSKYPNIGHTDRSMPVLTSRGCKFHCNFCYRLDKGYRARSADNIIEEIKQLKEKYNVTFISFYDELFMSSKKRMESICNAMIDAKLNIHFNCDGRLNYANPETLKLMKKAGCVFINYGIESYDNQVMKNMHKALTIDIVNKGVKNTLDVGISPGLNIIFGNYGDTREILRKGVKFIKKYHDFAYLRTIRPVTPYPGSELYYDAIKLGLLKGPKDFYENKHKNSDLIAINFTDMTDKEVYDALFEANKELLEFHYKHIIKENIDVTKELYFGKKKGFRGYRHT